MRTIGIKSRVGFTLIELMIVVGIIGILASIAIPAFTKYKRNVRRSEATNTMGALYKGAASYWTQVFLAPSSVGAGQLDGEERTRCATQDSDPIVDPGIPTEVGEKQMSTHSTNVAFRTLGLSDQPLYYSYQISGADGCQVTSGSALIGEGDEAYLFYAAALNTDGSFDMGTSQVLVHNEELIRQPGVSWTKFSF